MTISALRAAAPDPRPRVLVVGKECVGKSQLVASLTGRSPEVANFPGTTVAVEEFEGEELLFLDAPGILRASDTETTRLALDRLREEDVVLLVVQATHLDDDLADLLPLVAGKRGAVAVTFWDKVGAGPAADEALRRLSAEAGIPFVPVDARRLTAAERESLLASLASPAPFLTPALAARAGWRIAPRDGIFERRGAGPAVALLLLALPAVAAVWGANAFAGLVDPFVAGLVREVSGPLERLPAVAAALLGGRYGLVTMGPLLLVWAVPTVVVFALLLGAYKASGLVDRMNVALEPLVRPFGLTGRDLVRVLMGFGCNVPAVLATRACSACTRPAAISAISFGAACSYQLPATLAVLAATGRPSLAFAFLGVLGAATLAFLRVGAPRLAARGNDPVVLSRRVFLVWPRPAALWREARTTLAHFFLRALPVFFAITLAASLLDVAGLLDAAARLLAPVTALFRLPPETALPIVLASIRKDGILLFLREGAGGTAQLVAPLTGLQVLTAVFLAGTLLPCLVTALTIARETGPRFAARLLARQALFALAIGLVLAWSGRLVP